ncbi:glycosyltransferase family 4 protein [Leucobacter albus]|uniref:Glycosyltransferase family 4 protein n=1 Tax=Leucobacter albus TaxID=272210 RepID=A0ABW3TKY6_9MICO
MAQRILVVGQHFWPEQFRVNDIVDFMIDEGVEVDVLCGRPNYPSGQLAPGYTLWNRKIERYRTATVYRSFEIPRGNNSNLRILLNYVSFPVTSLFRVPRLLFKKYDRVFIYQLSPVMMSFAGIVLGKMKRIPTTMYVLDLWPENLYSVLDIRSGLLRRIAESVSHWHYRRVDRLVALSSRMRDRLLEVTSKSPSDVIVVPQVAEKLYETTIVDEELSERFAETFNVVFTGNISPAQSFSTMLDAAEILEKSGISGIRWIIVGDGMSRLAVEQEVAHRGLEHLFAFEGHHPVEEMPKYTHIADVLVGCLVRSDLLEATVPAKVMSYIAAAKPIVLAMDGEVQSLVATTIRCGYAGPTGDAETLAANIRRMFLLTPQARAEMGERARAYHFEHFERNKVLTRLLEFIQR